MVATALAGQSLDVQCGDGECVRIMTGAPMPPGTDTVVMQEQTEQVGDDTIRIDARHRRGQNVRQAGEDIARGASVSWRGVDSGRPTSACWRRSDLPSCAFAVVRAWRSSTGDELRSIGETLGEGEIYDSNRYTLFAMLKEAGADIVDLGVVRDDPAALADAFATASATADVVITSGGVSVGEADYTKQILAESGEMSFWTIAMKPGRPLTFGRLGDAAFFGLPGNPVAVMLTFQQFVLPALSLIAGAGWPQRLVVQARSA